MAGFELATASRIVFGSGALTEAGPAAAAMGRHALVVTGRDPGRCRPLIDLLDAHGVAHERFGVSGEPSTGDVQRACDLARAAGCDMTIGIGGGSALDTAKAVAAMLANPGELIDYLEVIGRGRKLESPSVPCIAIPTTAGTGSEVTRNAVVASPEHRVKVSLRSAHMLPDLAIVDPDLTRGLPPAIAAATGLDALSQLIEPYVSRLASPLVDPLCREGIRLAARSLERACATGDDGARAEMGLAALWSGIALANAKLGAVHGIAGPLGGMFDSAPHGAVCGRLLGPVMRVNLAALRARASDSPSLERYRDAARLLTGDPSATADDSAAWIDGLCTRLGVPGLGSHGIGERDFEALIAAAARASSMRGNPIELSADELRQILSAAL